MYTTYSWQLVGIADLARNKKDETPIPQTVNPQYPDFFSVYARAFLMYKVLGWGNFPTNPLVTDTAPPVLCPFRLRSITDEQHVRFMRFIRASPLSQFWVGPRNHISSVGCRSSLLIDTRERVPVTGGCLDRGVPLMTQWPCPFSLMSPPVAYYLKRPWFTKNNNDGCRVVEFRRMLALVTDWKCFSVN